MIELKDSKLVIGYFNECIYKAKEEEIVLSDLIEGSKPLLNTMLGANGYELKEFKDYDAVYDDLKGARTNLPDLMIIPPSIYSHLH